MKILINIIAAYIFTAYTIGIALSINFLFIRIVSEVICFFELFYICSMTIVDCNCICNLIIFVIKIDFFPIITIFIIPITSFIILLYINPFEVIKVGSSYSIFDTRMIIS